VDPLTPVELIRQVVVAISGWQLANTIRDNAIIFVTDAIKSWGKTELTNQLARLQSNAALAQQIEDATERAAKQWALEYPDRELVAAVVQDTNFIDLPSVREAVQSIARNPFNPVPTEILHDKFSQILPSRFESRRIEDGIAVFLECLRQEFVGISELREVLHVVSELQTAHSAQQTEMLATALPRIEEALKRIESKLNPADEQTLRDYLTRAANQYVSLYPPGAIQPIRQIQVLLDEMYVSLEAEPIQPKDVIIRSFQNVEAETPTDSAQCDGYKPAHPLVLSELLCQSNALAVLGDPGSGKTTHLRYLVRRHANALQNGQKSMRDLGVVRLPIYLRLGNFAENGGGRSLGDFLLQAVRNDSGADPALIAIIKARLAQGTCLVLLDGIDEIVDLSKRAEIARQVDLLIRTYQARGNQFIVTSRVEAYRLTPIAGDIPHFRIRNLSDQQIQKLLERWCNAVERFESPDLASNNLTEKIQKDVASIYQAIAANPGVRRLASNPLHLNTIALIHRMGARLPQRRVELYRTVVDILLRNWQLARGIPESALVREANATRLLAELAAWIHESRPSGIVPEAQVRAKLATVVGTIQGQEPDHPDVLNAVNDFLFRVRQYTGLLVEGPNRCYSFMHATIQEYFAARWLIACPRESARRIRRYLHRPYWTEPILLAISYFGMEFPAEVSEFVEEAILGKNLGGPSPYENILFRDLLFALRGLGDQEIDRTLREPIVKSAVQLATGLVSASRYELLQQRLAQLIHDLQGSTAGNELRESLVTALRDPAERVRAGAAFALSKVVLSPQTVTALLNAMLDENEGVRESVTIALHNATFSAEAVATLLTALGDENDQVRASAAVALGNVTLPPEAVTCLLKAMRDKESQVRASAAEALSRATLTDESVIILLTALRDPNSKVRAIAADALGNLVSFPESLEALLVALRDKNSTVRASAAEALQHIPLSPEAVTALLDALKDENSKVRLGATEALQRATLSSNAIVALLGVLRDANSKVRQSASEALRNCTLSTESRTALVAALKDENIHVRATAAIALRNATLDLTTGAALLSALDDEDKHVRAGAAVAISNATLADEAVTLFISALRDGKDHIRVCAVDSLRNATTQPGVIPALLTALYDSNPRVCSIAANVLSNSTLPADAVATLLVAVSNEPNSKVRAAAAIALRNAVASAEVIAVLLVALRDKVSNVRANVATALGNATSSETVVKALLGILTDRNNQVRASAVKALKGAIARTDVVNALLTRLCDVDEHVRVNTAEVLRNVAHRPEVVDALLMTLEDENEHVRISTTNALENASLHAGAVNALLAALCEKSERIRASAASALSNATLSSEAINALLKALDDENERVRVSAADALAHIVLQPQARRLPDLAERIANCLNRPEIDQVSGFWMRHPRNSLFVALDAVAPGPSIANE
jgi:HEAT repeat protein